MRNLRSQQLHSQQLERAVARADRLAQEQAGGRESSSQETLERETEAARVAEERDRRANEALERCVANERAAKLEAQDALQKARTLQRERPNGARAANKNKNKKTRGSSEYARLGERERESGRILFSFAPLCARA